MYRMPADGCAKVTHLSCMPLEVSYHECAPTSGIRSTEWVLTGFTLPSNPNVKTLT
jgi:hypothetical protein